MRGEGTPITEEYVNMLIEVFGVSLLAGIILPFAVAMASSPYADVPVRVAGVLLLVVVGFLFYLAVRAWRKYEEQKDRGE